ncbi:3'-5' exonuclease [Lachnospiraceae bacterium 29-84]
MKYIFIDLEMNPVDKRFKEIKEICRSEIIEIGAIVLDESFRQIESYREYVKPEFSNQIMVGITDLTGISLNMLVGADTFSVAIEKFADWCCKDGEDFMVYAWSGNDLEQIQKEMEVKHIPESATLSKLFGNWNDFQEYFCRLIESEKPVSLERALAMAGYGFDGKMHDAMWDAKNTADLFVASQNEEELLQNIKMIQEKTEHSEESAVTLGDIFNFGKISF